MKNGVVLVNGLYIYDRFLTILYGWQVPNKAKRSWDLITTAEMKELSSLCLTLNKNIDEKVRNIWRNWKYKYSSNWDEIYNRNEFENMLKKEQIKCYNYREPIVMHNKVK